MSMYMTKTIFKNVVKVINFEKGNGLGYSL